MASVLEKLQETNPAAEIWWDSSPLVYRSWARKIIDGAPPEKAAAWREQLRRLLDPNASERTLVRGATTNPPLTLAAIRDDPGPWSRLVRQLIEDHPDAGVEGIYWMTYKEVVARGAAMLRAVWDASARRYGYVSAQVDPRDCFSAERMLAQGLELAELAPNIMVKVPGTREGYEVIEELTARGIATNNTLSFTVPQFVTCMEAVRRGLERAKRQGVSLFRWRSVITHMSARYGTLGDLKMQADARGVALGESELRWAELAIFKRAYRIIADNGYPSKMLMCSMRISPPTSDGSAASWHIEKIAGADVVYTCPPVYIAALMGVEDRMREFDAHAIHEEPPRAILDVLVRLPYFVQAYEPDGMRPTDFNRHGALVATAAEFANATRAMVDFVAQQFQIRSHVLTPSAAGPTTLR